jgi:hypothetical protein
VAIIAETDRDFQAERTSGTEQEFELRYPIAA